MPPSQLNSTNPTAPVDLIATAIHHVLAGEPLVEVAKAHNLDTAQLADAMEVYDRAGRIALYDLAVDATWWQAHLEFRAWPQAESTACAVLVPLLNEWRTNGLIHRWWFIRKAPCWRLRLHSTTDHDELSTYAASEFNKLVMQGHLATWRSSHYEPEALAFGGPAGIRIAHELFSADSANLLACARIGHMPLGRLELSMLLCTQLFRAAGQEQFEVGDIWNRVTQLRPHSQHVSEAGHHVNLTRQLRTLLAYDTRPDGPIFSAAGPLCTVRDWVRSFHVAGNDLARAATEANLHRGIRDILSHHVIFHWNRIGLDSNIQHVLAHAAMNALLES